jgi:hypothetical protein
MGFHRCTQVTIYSQRQIKILATLPVRVFVFQFCDLVKLSIIIHKRKLAKSGYRSEREVEKFKVQEPIV